tara:strand:- start:184 stop:297 length:114 start_codon:yes stop_codon:yes gene_type:complete
MSDLTGWYSFTLEQLSKVFEGENVKKNIIPIIKLFTG